MTAFYVKQTTGDYDTATGASPTSTTQVPVQAIVMDLTLSSNGLGLRPGTLIEAGDKQLFIRPPERTDPMAAPLQIDMATDRVIVNGTKYKVVTFKEVNPMGSEVVLIELYIRR